MVVFKIIALDLLVIRHCLVNCITLSLFYQHVYTDLGAPTHWGLGEIDGLLVPPGKACKLLTDHLITG